MKRTILTAFALLLAVTLQAQRRVNNRLYNPDPAPVVSGDRLYVFTGHDLDTATYFRMPDWQVFSSTDMKHWTDHGIVLSTANFKWAKQGDNAWASQAIERNGKWYWYVAAEDTTKHLHGIGVAVADRPEGPWADPIGRPLIPGDWGFIDPTVFIDDDGQAYLFWGNNGCWYAKLNEDMISIDKSFANNGICDMRAMLDDEAQFGPKCLKMDYQLHKKVMKTGFEEAPWIYKIGDTYFLEYAAGGVPEHWAYSTAKSIHGPWHYEGRITDESPGSFTIHGGTIDFKGKSYLFYHDGIPSGGNGFRRTTAFREFQRMKDGRIPKIDIQTVNDGQSSETTPCGPVPTENQLQWQDMEMYAFIHYSLNTYTDQEWGFGDEDPKLFNPSNLDCKQWARVCKQAGMKGIIFTAKHHCGFCMWPSDYTEYSVKNSPWKEGKGDVVRELADACREEGLKFAVYLSPWDRNHPEYGRQEYVTYFRHQLRELLSNYGDIFEVWFDGANGGDGWYGGANETRKIDRTTYYQWPETYKMIRELQPNCLIWNDGSDRGDLRWVGTEAGNVGETNWSLLNHDGEVTWSMLHYGLEDGDSWVPGETNTSIRPGWFYHELENEHVKSLSKLMDTYYKSVGRNSTLLLNFPIAPNGRIHPNDSLRGIAFNKMIQEVFKEDLAKSAKIKTDGNETIITFSKPTTFNRFVAEEDIRYGQRVKQFSLEAEVDGQWVPLKDELVEGSNGLTTIGHRRIVCFPNVTATRLRFTIVDSKCEPIISRVSIYLAPALTADIPDSGEKRSSNLHYFFSNPKQMMIDWDTEQTITSFRYLPPQNSKEGMVTHYTLWASTDWTNWSKLASGEFSNIINNPIWQTIKFAPVKAKMLRLDADRLAEGDRMAFDDVEVVKE